MSKSIFKDGDAPSGAIKEPEVLTLSGPPQSELSSKSNSNKFRQSYVFTKPFINSFIFYFQFIKTILVPDLTVGESK